MYNRLAKRGQGFTIVELMIVVVVIVILATIVTVVYSGIQDKAYTAKAASQADSYQKALDVFALKLGGYPVTDSQGICLGSEIDYPADRFFESGQCTSWGTSVDDSFNNQLRSINLGVSSGATNRSSLDGDGYIRGAIYYGPDASGGAIIYNSNTGNCPVGSNMRWYDDFVECIVPVGDFPDADYYNLLNGGENGGVPA